MGYERRKMKAVSKKMIVTIVMLIFAFLLKKPLLADTQYSGPGCMVNLTYFDIESGQALYSCTFSGQPIVTLKYKNTTYIFETIWNGGNDFSFKSLTLPSAWTGGRIQLSPVAPDRYQIASGTRELDFYTMTKHWAVSASKLQHYVDLMVPVIKKEHKFNISEKAGKWNSAFMDAVLEQKNGKLYVYITQNRFPLTRGSDYLLRFGPVQSNGYKDVIMHGSRCFSGERVIGKVKSNVTFAETNTKNQTNSTTKNSNKKNNTTTKKKNTSDTKTKKKTSVFKVGDTFTKGNFIFKILTLKNKKGTVKLIKIKKITGTVKFPESIKKNGYTFTLTQIGNNVFSAQATLKKVTLNSSVMSIGNRAFYGCRGLKTVVLNKKLKIIGANAFADCISLKVITIPSNVTTIKAGAFKGDVKLATIKIKSKKLKVVGKGALNNTAKSIHIELPDNNRSLFNKLVASIIR